MEFQYYKIKKQKEIKRPKSFNGTIILLNINIEHEENTQLHDLLMNILNAININIENSFILNIEANDTSIAEFFSDKQVKNIVAFGIHPEMINFKANLIPYRVLRILDKNVLFSASLNDLLNNKGLKQKLWKSIKVI